MPDETKQFQVEMALHEFQQYLSDQLPPLVVADSMAVLMRCSPEVVANVIQAWASWQFRSAPAVPVSDYFYHAIKKIHLIGEYNLIPPSEIAAYLGGLKSYVLQSCPPAERDLLRQNLNTIHDTSLSGGSAVEVIYRQTGGHASTTVPAPDSSAGTDSATFALLMRRIEQQLKAFSDSKNPEVAEKQQDILMEALAQAARSAQMTIEFEKAMEQIRSLGLQTGTEDVFRALGRDIPEWSFTPKPDLQMPEDSNLKAMHRIVTQAEDAKEGSERFHQMVNAAIERFNEGHLTQAVSMIDLATRILEAKEIPEDAAKNLRTRAHEYLDSDQMRKYSESVDQHALLRRFLNFFFALTPEGLLGSLRTEQKRERRRLLLALLEAHGDAARKFAMRHLEIPLGNSYTDEEIYFRRNLLFLTRKVAPGAGQHSEEVEVVCRHAQLAVPSVLLKEAIACLGQLKDARAERQLLSLMEQTESALLASRDIKEDQELSSLLDRIVSALARLASPAAQQRVLEHAFKKKRKLGNTVKRLAELGSHDLSSNPAVIERLLVALRENHPAKWKTLFTQNKKEDLEYLVEALSGTAHPRVQEALEEISRKFPDTPAGTRAAKIVSHVAEVQTPKSVAVEQQRPASVLTGDLEIFGLPGLFQSLSDHSVTGQLTLKSSEGETFAVAELENGKLSACRLGSLNNETAFYQLFERPRTGTFHFVRNQTAPESHFNRDILPLMMEAIRRYDELKQAEGVLPDDIRLAAVSEKPVALAEETDGLLFRDLWNAVRKGATARECEHFINADSYRIRRLLVHWLQTGCIAAR